MGYSDQNLFSLFGTNRTWVKSAEKDDFKHENGWVSQKNLRKNNIIPLKKNRTRLQVGYFVCSAISVAISVTHYDQCG